MPVTVCLRTPRSCPTRLFQPFYLLALWVKANGHCLPMAGFHAAPLALHWGFLNNEDYSPAPARQGGAAFHTGPLRLWKPFDEPFRWIVSSCHLAIPPCGGFYHT